MANHDINDPGTAAGIERQLGEVVGTVRMTVTAIESLRQSIERLAEKSAFKGDLDQTRVSFAEDLRKTETRMQDEITSLSGSVNSLKSKVDQMKTLFASITGGAVVLGVLLKFVDFGVKITFGG